LKSDIIYSSWYKIGQTNRRDIIGKGISLLGRLRCLLGNWLLGSLLGGCLLGNDLLGDDLLGDWLLGDWLLGEDLLWGFLECYNINMN
jgi:hypothetical protein